MRDWHGCPGPVSTVDDSTTPGWGSNQGDRPIGAIKRLDDHDALMVLPPDTTMTAVAAVPKLRTGAQQHSSTVRNGARPAGAERLPPLLAISQATPSLDAESETLLQTALEVLMRHRTTLVIAHRLATELSCDRILLVDQGRIVEQGSHAAVVAQKDCMQGSPGCSLSTLDPGIGKRQSAAESRRFGEMQRAPAAHRRRPGRFA